MTSEAVAKQREKASRQVMETWREELANKPSTAKARVLEAVLPCLEE